MIIDGRKIAEELINGLKEKFAREKQRKFLAVFCAGENSAMESFVRQKERTARELGIDFRMYEFPEKITQDELRKEASKIVLHKTCGGAIVQLPLPNHINPQYVLNAIPREKDIDVLGERALGAFYAGRSSVLPPAVGTLQEVFKFCSEKFEIQSTKSEIPILSRILDRVGTNSNDKNLKPETFLDLENLNLAASKVAVVGLGNLVGKPIATWLQGKCKEIYLLDKGSDFDVLKSSDVVVLGTGVPGLIKPEILKDDALVIDFGYGRKQMADGRWQMTGDFDSSSLSSSLLSWTPTPGGVGPILVAKLFENFYKLTLG